MTSSRDNVAVLDRKMAREKDTVVMRYLHSESSELFRRCVPCLGGALVLVLASLFSPSCRGERRRALADLHAAEPRTRADAVLTLAALDGPDSLGKIGPLIKDPSAGVRLAVVRALARMKSDATMPLLFTALRDKDPQVRLAAVDALGAIGSSRARDQLVHMLTDRDPVTRRAAAASLRRLGLDRAAQVEALARVRLQALLSAARSRRPAVRARAAEDLGLCGMPEALPALKRLLEDPSGIVADEALVALAAMGTGPALRILRRALASGNFHVRARLLDALSQLSPSRLALVADAIPVRKVAPLLVGMDRDCGEHCPLSCKTLCSWIAAPDWRAARSAWLVARRGSCPCSARALSGIRDPEKRVFLVLSSKETPSRADLQDLARRYAGHPAAGLMGPLLARLPENLRSLVRKEALARIHAYIRDSVSWLSEKDWKSLEQDPAATVLGKPPAVPQDKKARKLARLLSAYHPRSWKHVALLPPMIPRSSAESALDILGWLAGGEKDLLEFAVRGPKDLRPAALAAISHRSRKVDEALVQAIRSALGGPVTSRAAAARALRGAGSQALVMLAQLLERDPSEVVRAEAAKSLAAIDLPGCRKALRMALRNRPEPAVVRALVASGDGAAAPLLLAVLKANPESLEMRVLVIQALGRLGSPGQDGLVEALLDQLGHPNAQVRAAAAQALGALGGSAAVQGLEVCTHDFSGMVRRACRQALSGTKGAAAPHS